MAAHRRGREANNHTTDPSHMPPAHRAHSAGVDGVIAWATAFGPMTEAMVRRLIDATPVREQGWRSARGLRRIDEKYRPERTERACAHALFFGARSYRPVANILSLGREKLPLPDENPTAAPAIEHENLRGADYFH